MFKFLITYSSCKGIQYMYCTYIIIGNGGETEDDDEEGERKRRRNAVTTIKFTHI